MPVAPTARTLAPARLLADAVEAPLRQTASLARRGHRPWPVPRRLWAMGQTWLDLLFVHWRVPWDALRELVPGTLSLDRFDGDAWIGVTPFELVGLRPSFAPPLPGMCRFGELNVRTYVTVDGRPGIHFFSLDAASRTAVTLARRLYRLPYADADIRIERAGGTVAFAARRVHGRARFAARYAPGARLGTPAPGTLEHFLTERYCLYVTEGERVFRAEIHHAPWELHEAEADLELDALLPGRLVPTGRPLLHYAERQDVVAWLLEEVERPGSVRRIRLEETLDGGR